MGLFGRKPAKGITQYEMTRNRLHGKMRSVLPSGRTGDRKMGALDAALGVAMDPDRNTPRTQHVIQPEEFETVVSMLQKRKVITTKEADRLRHVAEKDLND